MTQSSRVLFGASVVLPKHLCYGRYVLEKIVNFKNRTALINAIKGDEISFSEMAQQVVNVASALLELGVKRGDVIAISSDNRIEILITFLAVLCTEGTITILNSSYGKDELLHALNISKPKYMFLSEDTYKKNFKDIKRINLVNKFILFDDVPSHNGVILYKDIIQKHIDISTFSAPDFKGEMRTALILYSSGTTGLAKGAIITHSNLIATGDQTLFTTIPKKVLTIAPWSSCMGLLCTMAEIVVGKTTVFLPRFDERIYLHTIQKYKIGVLAVPPPLLVMLTKSTIAQEYDISSVEIIYCGGAPLSVTIMSELKKRYPHIRHVLQGFGMTEASGSLTKESDQAPRPGSVGQIAAGNIIKVVDIETRKTLGPGEQGEICLKGPVLFEGYIGKSINEDLDDEGFYKTGDIGYYDEDGYFYIVDRLKELIKYKAWQVAPAEIEALLLQHPAVKDVGIVGAPDALAGELPTAFIVKQPDAQVTEKDIIDYVASKVSPWKRLSGGVIFLQEIPKNPSGKILRRELKAMLKKIPLSKL